MTAIGTRKYGRDIGKRNNAQTHPFVWHACIDCGKTRWVEERRGQAVSVRCRSCNGRQKMLTGMFVGAKNPCWRGGRRKRQDGYIEIRLLKDDFFYPMAKADGYVREHRLVVARALGRCLLPWEVVHHKGNYAKDDNRYPETLELLPDKRWHLVDVKTKAYIKGLENKIKKLEAKLARV